MNWYSQAGQDKWVHELKPSPGYFVDLGAYNGVDTSNTLALEERGWTGVCVEANPDYHMSLTENRPTATCLHCAVSGRTQLFHWEGQTPSANLLAPRVPGYTLDDLLNVVNAPELLDYVSMDLEGMELEVLEAYDFSRRIDLMTVEHNLYCDGPAKKEALHALLTDRGFVRVVEDAPCLDPNPAYYGQPYEDWYAASDFLLAS